jgi:hypothetical protein
VNLHALSETRELVARLVEGDQFSRSLGMAG